MFQQYPSDVSEHLKKICLQMQTFNKKSKF